MRVRANELSFRVHELDGRDAVRREAMPTAEPADPATERVPDDADVRRRAGERRKSVLGRGFADLRPEDASLGTRGASLGIDPDAAHAFGLDQNGVRERSHRGRVVSGSLRSDAEAPAARPTDDRDDVFRRFRQRDGRRLLVDG